MAAAGFYFIPEEGGMDSAMCPYCETEIDQWEKNDDPMYRFSNLGMRISNKHQCVAFL
jgi:hypothetical protein